MIKRKDYQALSILKSEDLKKLENAGLVIVRKEELEALESTVNDLTDALAEVEVNVL